MPSPYMIFVAGLTGSGKTTLLEKTVKYLKIDDYVKVILDECVEENQEYRKKVAKILNNMKKNNFEITEDTYTEFQKAYFDVRTRYCDTMVDNIVVDNVRKRKNIIVETQGLGYHDYIKFYGDRYKIVLAYSLVDFFKIIRRNEDRFMTQVKKFYQGGRSPRLPDVRYDKGGQFEQKFRGLRNTILRIMAEDCFNLKNRNFCGNHKLFKLLLFDNNGKEMKLVADINKENNMTPSEVSMILDTYMKFPY